MFTLYSKLRTTLLSSNKMNYKSRLPQLIIIASCSFIVLNLVFTSDKTSIIFWTKVISAAILIRAMYTIIRRRKNDGKLK